MNSVIVMDNSLIQQTNEKFMIFTSSKNDIKNWLIEKTTFGSELLKPDYYTLVKFWIG